MPSRYAVVATDVGFTDANWPDGFDADGLLIRLESHELDKMCQRQTLRLSTPSVPADVAMRCQVDAPVNVKQESMRSEVWILQRPDSAVR